MRAGWKGGEWGLSVGQMEGPLVPVHPVPSVRPLWLSYGPRPFRPFRTVPVPSVRLHKGDFLEGGRPVLVHHLVEGEQRVEHALDVTLAKVQTAGLLEALRLIKSRSNCDQIVNRLSNNSKQIKFNPF